MMYLTEKQERGIKKLDNYLEKYKLPKFYKIVGKRVHAYELMFGPLVPNDYRVIVQYKNIDCYVSFSLDSQVFEKATWKQIKSFITSYIDSAIASLKETINEHKSR